MTVTAAARGFIFSSNSFIDVGDTDGCLLLDIIGNFTPIVLSPKWRFSNLNIFLFLSPWCSITFTFHCNTLVMSQNEKLFESRLYPYVSAKNLGIGGRNWQQPKNSSEATNNLDWPHFSWGPLRVSMEVGEVVGSVIGSVQEGSLEVCKESLKASIICLPLKKQLSIFVCVF